MPISFGASRYRGGSAPTDPALVFVSSIGSSRLGGGWRRSDAVTSAANLVSVPDFRGPGHAMDLLANAGGGGTPPTVDADYMITDGASNYIGNLTADALFAIDGTKAHTIALMGEIVGTPSFLGGLIDSQSGSDLALFQSSGGILKMFGMAHTVPKAFPAPGVRSLIIASTPKHYGMASSDPGGGGANSRLWLLDFVGRGFNGEPLTLVSTAALLSLGRYSTAYGGLKLSTILFMSDSMVWQDRSALETFAIAEGCDLYGQPDSTGIGVMLGDSRTWGAETSNPDASVPVSTSGTGWPSRVQSLVNGRGTKIDIINRGLSGVTLADVITPQTGHTTSYFDDLLAMVASPARRAAGLPESINVGLGTNDVDSGTSAATIQGWFGSMITKAHAAGTKIGMWTIPPARGWFGTPKEAVRLAVNTWILASAADCRIDCRLASDGGTLFLADPSGGSDTITTNATYFFQTVGLHLTELGNTKLGDLMDTSLHGAGLI